MNDQDFLEPERLRAFVAVAETGGFTRASTRLHLTQSTISTQVRRLEDAIGRTLFERSHQSSRLTKDGEAMLGYARELLAVLARADRHFRQPALKGTVRFGVVEDFNATALPDMLGRLRREHQHLELRTETGLSAELTRRLDAGDLDLVLAKRVPGRAQGEFLCRQKLLWVGLPGIVAAGKPVPLALYPVPSVSREIILRCLREHERQWTVHFESLSLSGLRAAVLAGIGVTALGLGTIPQGLETLPAGVLPPLEEAEYMLEHNPQSKEQVVVTFGNILRRAASRIMDRLADDQAGLLAASK